MKQNKAERSVFANGHDFIRSEIFAKGHDFSRAVEESL